jgi:tRNA-modifying protein YgfZ
MPLSAHPLTYLGVLKFSGADAAAFLQGQVSSDIAKLSQGSAQLAAYSSPQGRVLAILWLIKWADDIFAIVPRELAGPCVARLKKFVMRAKVSVEDKTGEYSVGGIFTGTDPVSAETSPLQCVTAVLPQDPSRTFLIGDSPAALAGDVRHEADFERRWRAADIRAGLPQVYAATQEQFVAQMLNLDLVDGISFKKGCYTGQEIIARTQHLGRIKRRMMRWALPAGHYAPGDAVRLADGRRGTIVDAVESGDGQWEALAVLPLQAGPSTAEEIADGNKVSVATPLDLPYGPELAQR